MKDAPFLDDRLHTDRADRGPVPAERPIAPGHSNPGRSDPGCSNNDTPRWTGEPRPRHTDARRLWAFVIRAPESVIFSLAILLCIVGVYLSTGTMFGVAVLLVFTALGYAMTAFGFSTVVFIIAFFPGPRFELSLNQSLTRNSESLPGDRSLRSSAAPRVAIPGFGTGLSTAA